MNRATIAVALVVFFTISATPLITNAENAPSANTPVPDPKSNSRDDLQALSAVISTIIAKFDRSKTTVADIEAIEGQSFKASAPEYASLGTLMLSEFKGLPARQYFNANLRFLDTIKIQRPEVNSNAYRLDSSEIIDIENATSANPDFTKCINQRQIVDALKQNGWSEPVISPVSVSMHTVYAQKQNKASVLMLVTGGLLTGGVSRDADAKTNGPKLEANFSNGCLESLFVF